MGFRCRVIHAACMLAVLAACAPKPRVAGQGVDRDASVEASGGAAGARSDAAAPKRDSDVDVATDPSSEPPRDGGRDSAPNEPSVVVPPAPPGVTGSDLYEVTIVHDGVRSPAFVYRSVAPDKPYPEDDGGNEHRSPRRSMSWATFSTSVPVVAEVTLKAGSFTSAVVRPKRAGITPERVDARTLRVPIPGPGAKLSVELDDKTTNALLLFADPPEDPATIVPESGPGIYAPAPGATFAPPAGTTAVRFGVGVHDLGYVVLPTSIERVYLAGGALVYGAIQVAARPRFHVTGRGVLSGAKMVWRADKQTLAHHTGECEQTCVKMLEVRDVPDGLVDGVTIAESPYWNFVLDGSKVDMRRFKVLGNWRWNSDGPDVTSGSTVEDCFVQTNDDMFKMYWSNGTVRRCVAWHMHNGPIVQLGWWIKTIAGLRVSDLDVIHSEWVWTANTNNGAINHHWDQTVQVHGTGVISDTLFEDIRMEGTTLRAIGLFAPVGQTIRDMTIRNLSVDVFGGDLSGKGIQNAIRGDGGGRVEDVHIQNMTVGGTKVTAANATTLGQFVIDPASTARITFE